MFSSEHQAEPNQLHNTGPNNCLFLFFNREVCIKGLFDEQFELGIVGTLWIIRRCSTVVIFEILTNFNKVF